MAYYKYNYRCAAVKACKLQEIATDYNLKVSNKKFNVIAFQGMSPPVRSKLVLNNLTIELASYFNCLGCLLSYEQETELDFKLNNFHCACLKMYLQRYVICERRY